MSTSCYYSPGFPRVPDGSVLVILPQKQRETEISNLFFRVQKDKHCFYTDFTENIQRRADLAQWRAFVSGSVGAFNSSHTVPTRQPGRLMLRRTVQSVSASYRLIIRPVVGQRSLPPLSDVLFHVPLKYSPHFLSKTCDDVLLVGWDLGVIGVIGKAVTQFTL